jgi:hypothetical protein
MINRIIKLGLDRIPEYIEDFPEAITAMGGILPLLKAAV